MLGINDEVVTEEQMQRLIGCCVLFGFLSFSFLSTDIDFNRENCLKDPVVVRTPLFRMFIQLIESNQHLFGFLSSLTKYLENLCLFRTETLQTRLLNSIQPDLRWKTLIQRCSDEWNSENYLKMNREFSKENRA